MDFGHYQAEDFVLDESFQHYVWRTRADDVAFWEAWIARHPHKQEIVASAIQTILRLSVPEKAVPEADVHLAWGDLKSVLRNRERAVKNHSLRKRSVRPWRLAASVAVVLIAFGGGYWYWQTSQWTTHRTAYGQMQSVQLPDGSVVVLNGNTTLRYPNQWPDERRDVWIDGEAFFSVKKRLTKAGWQRLVVHTPDLRVEVTGTTFNVSRRRQRTRVVLNTGQVIVRRDTPGKSAKASVVLKPGDLVEYSGKNKPLSRRSVNPELYSAWHQGRLIFDNTPLSEVAEMIEAIYGKEVIFEDASQASRKLSGTIPTDNFDVLLLTLRKSFRLAIQSSNNQVVIRHAN